MAPWPTAGRKSSVVELLGHAVRERQTFQAGHGQNGSVEVAGVDFAEPRLDVAPEQANVEVRPDASQLRLSPQRCRTHHGPERQVDEVDPIPRNESVPHVFTRQKACQRKAGRQHRRQVLGRMDREVDVGGQQRRIEFLREEPLAARFGQRTILDRIACRADFQDGDRRLRPALGRRQSAARLVRLGQRQGASARAQSQRDRLTRHAVSLPGVPRPTIGSAVAMRKPCRSAAQGDRV